MRTNARDRRPIGPLEHPADPSDRVLRAHCGGPVRGDVVVPEASRRAGRSWWGA
jgi:hypothetical protein